MDNALGREPEETWDLLLLLPQPPWEACPAVLLLDRHTHPLLVSLEVCWSNSMALAGCEADFQCLLMLFIQIRAERASTAQRKKRRGIWKRNRFISISFPSCFQVFLGNDFFFFFTFISPFPNPYCRLVLFSRKISFL